MKYFDLFFISLACFFLVSNNIFGTNIGGTITENYTLTLAESPYVLTADLIVADSVTLIIEPGGYY